MEISLLDLFADSEIYDCYMLHAGYCYPVTDISKVKFYGYKSIDIIRSETPNLAVEIDCDELVSYLLHIRPIDKILPGQMTCRPHKINAPASRSLYSIL